MLDCKIVLSLIDGYRVSGLSSSKMLQGFSSTELVVEGCLFSLKDY